jgi:PadR family transcriptional regulator, regulatory protein PadR
MWGMSSEPSLTELRRGVLGPCVLALLAQRPRFGLELVRELAAAGGLLTSDGTVYPLLNRLRDAGLVTSQWQDAEGERARRYYFITEDGRKHLAAFRTEWTEFAATVRGVLFRPASGDRSDDEQDQGDVGRGQDQEKTGKPR